jgi:hypothetical protein
MQINPAFPQRCYSETLGVTQMASETIKILLMIALIGVIEVALHTPQIQGAVRRTMLMFFPSWRQRRLALRKARAARTPAQQ